MQTTIEKDVEMTASAIDLPNKDKNNSDDSQDDSSDDDHHLAWSERNREGHLRGVPRRFTLEVHAPQWFLTGGIMPFLPLVSIYSTW